MTLRIVETVATRRSLHQAEAAIVILECLVEALKQEPALGPSVAALLCFAEGFVKGVAEGGEGRVL